VGAIEIELVSGNRKLETGFEGVGGRHQISDHERQLTGIDLDRVAAGHGAAVGADGLGQEPAHIRAAADRGLDGVKLAGDGVRLDRLLGKQGARAAFALSKLRSISISLWWPEGCCASRTMAAGLPLAAPYALGARRPRSASSNQLRALNPNDALRVLTPGRCGFARAATSVLNR